MRSSVKLLLGVFCLLGILAVIYATAWGIGLSPDSVSYIAGARGIVAGAGFSSPSWDGSPVYITHHAPLYSAVLTFGGFVGLDPLQLAPWVNALLFALNIGLVGYLVGAPLGTKKLSAPFFVLICAWLILVSRTILEIHSMAWTEPLFIALSLASIIFLGGFIEHQQVREMIFAGVCTALACLTRYVGIVLIFSGLIAILLFSKSNLKQKISTIGIYSLVSALPLMIWLVRNWALAGSATNRAIAFHPPGMDQIRLGLSTLAGWLLVPDLAPGIIKLTMIVLVAGIVAYLSIKRSRFNKEGLPITFKILTLFLLFYLGFLIFSISFLDANTPLDGRLLSPVLVVGLCLIFSSLGWAYRIFSHRAVRVILVTGGILLALAYLPGGLEFIRNAHAEGLGFNNRMWNDSETIHLAQDLPAGIPIYSNLPDAVYIHAQHPAQRLPSRVSSVLQAENSKYSAQMDQIRNDLRYHSGIIVYFDAVSHSNYPSKSELLDELGSLSVEQVADGALLSLNLR